ncbi:hypothetical protein [Beijerinckia indica]|uniref:Uncharacterized protein n=1 Tax=Beijerinckia indica subsp. indica (strain ATCC 9039 / DSM 1715 / NCIMB 8712) TaxID=395963 RepID=B2IEQ8_BEII9|nr:hypothetical protein [Beijerinckia indica]ACB96998.1 hypothetical protein Bind_3441 [Beijerinckia indica subsp. indica ATCC 9039]
MSDCPSEGPDYRAFFLDEAGKIKKSKVLKACQTDAEAIAAAETLHDGRRLEVFDGCRLVAALPERPADAS